MLFSPESEDVYLEENKVASSAIAFKTKDSPFDESLFSALLTANSEENFFPDTKKIEDYCFTLTGGSPMLANFRNLTAGTHIYLPQVLGNSNRTIGNIPRNPLLQARKLPII